METRLIEVSVRGQEISCTVQHPYPRTNTVQYLHVHFDADAIWDPLKKIAVFRRSGTATVAVPLDETMMCEMPPQMMAVPGYSGPVTVHIGLIGVGEDGSRLTTGEVPVTVNPSCYTVGKTPHPPAPDVYEELLRLIREAAENDVEEIRAALDAYFAENPIDVSGKLDKNQGAANAGKVLGIDEDGAVVPVDAPTGNEGGIVVETDPTVPAWAKQPNKPAYTAEEVGALPKTTEIPTVPTNISDFVNDAGYAKIVTVKITKNEDGTYASSHTPQEIYAATQAGAVVEASDANGGRYSLYTCNERAAQFLTMGVRGSSGKRILYTETFVISGDKVGKGTTETPIPVAPVPMVGATDTAAGTAGLVPAPAAGDDDKFLRGDGTWREIKQGALAGKDTVAKTDLDSDVQASLNKANTALQAYTETDPTVPAWAKASTKPKYTASEVGADASGTADSKVSAHNTSEASHNDIRLLISGLTARLNAIADSDDTTLDQLSEIVAYIKANKGLIDSITTDKVNVADIINNLTTSATNKPLSAKMGVELKALIDAIKIPTSLPASDVYAWAKQPEKPAYTADEVGAIPQGQLDSAVNQALAQAKESGEFDGAPGETGPQGPKGDPYTLTEADKAEIAAAVIERLGGNPIFGYVDEDNNIIVQGDLADGTYSVKYEMENGNVVNIGNMVLDSNVYYSVTSTLTNCTINNSAKTVVEGGSYAATITAKDGYELKSLTVTMGGSPVSVSGGSISIASVTGDIVITAVAEEEVVEVEHTNFCVPLGDGWISGGRCSSSGADREDSEAFALTNYIAVQNGDILSVQNLAVSTSTYSGLYKSDKTAIGGFTFPDSGAKSGYVKDVSINGGQCQFTIDNANAGYIRICGKPTQGIIGSGTFEQTYDINALNIIVNIKRNGTWL